jgi:hypothetical protein
MDPAAKYVPSSTFPSKSITLPSILASLKGQSLSKVLYSYARLGSTTIPISAP